MEKYRVGLGYDLHRFTEKKDFMLLGGFRINCGFGLEAVSDGDAVLHAVSDAVCGAACLGDIGDYFPPSDKKNQGADSKRIAETILAKIKKKYKIENIDITLVAEKPRLVSYKKDITSSLKDVFEIPDVNLKIKSKEKKEVLGGAGALSCLAVVLLKGF
ncbi:MAG: 2-C-methyl-D-erythritol 2,4-cyclodiphosphate synthase [Candidatus Omnitrophica bacterium]|nr:2-C-methyl-D-erythritol 2,4-cyclodiphosphate synthase [Candidatus Omnitrophota bacterium]MCF7877123.1 2-C-methyl-D-erythritol 2,4-cyclodiphosphate synthase [Candidatus Omnitrophota bacterium]MCF7878736.1 2-C-methyl-D-erythritol 2,4-cyclodiphosphate synthase [Candidatus Omnitrophota bacterium]MCF7892803.1 2-C-methyl-D-erythritol 2,4-cyclodiphosphate synthase [Candidatus Omnitrophota bacterium]